MVTPNPLLDLAPGVGQIQWTIEWAVLTRTLEDTGQRLHPFASGAVTANTSGQVKRTLSGVVLGDVERRTVDLFKARVQPRVVLEDGTVWPVGVFMFTDDALHVGTYASTLSVSLMDQGYILKQETKEAFAVAPGGGILDAVVALLDQVGITNRRLPLSNPPIADPNNWPPGTARQTILDYLCVSAGWLPGYFGNDGWYVIRIPPNVDTEQPDHVYTGRRVQYGTPVVQSNLLDAPNTIVVIGTGPSKGDISAVAYVDPSLPYSVPNRDGLEVVDTTTMQGLVSTEQAQQIADTKAASAVGYRGQTFTGVIDPRHDLFQTVAYLDGVVYRELSWTLPVEPTGGFMTHILTLGGFPSGS